MKSIAIVSSRKHRHPIIPQANNQQNCDRTTYRVYGKTTDTMRDVKGLLLKADAALADAPQLDVLQVPGGFEQEALMEDEEVLS